MEKFTFHNREWNTTSVDKIKELRQVVDMAFKQISLMPNKDTNAKTLRKWKENVHRTLEPILWAICCNTYTMWKIKHPSQVDGVRDLKWNWWHDTNVKRDAESGTKSQKPEKKQKRRT